MPYFLFWRNPLAGTWLVGWLHEMPGSIFLKAPEDTRIAQVRSTTTTKPRAKVATIAAFSHQQQHLDDQRRQEEQRERKMTETDLPDVKSYRLVQVSNLFFFQAAFCYLLSAMKEMTRKTAEDDSQAWILMLLGALGWVVVGFLDWFNKRHWFHIFLVMAGVFGLASAALRLETEPGSEMLNFLSVHCFLLEAVSLIRQNRHMSFSLVMGFVRVADIFFFLGAFTDILLSYVYLGQQEELSTEERLIALRRGELTSSVFWVVSAIGNIVVTVIAGKSGMKTSKEVPGEESTNLSQMATMA
jgi:hypothetical protein